MTNLISKAVILALFLGLVKYSIAMPESDAGNTPTASMTVAELETAADAARAQKDYKLAIQLFRVALRKDPTNAVLYNKTGIAELQSSNLSAARSDFDKAAKLDRKYAEAYNNLGAVSYFQKRFDKAAREFKKALALDETNASFHVNLGAAWFGQEKFDRAMVEYARALELDPNVLDRNSKAGVSAILSNPEERAKYDYMLAKLYAKRGDLDRCLECLRKAKENGYHDIANVYKEQEFAGLWQDARLAGVVPAPKR